MIITSTSKLFFCWRNNDFWSVFDGIKDIVVPRFVGVIVEVISQLATLSKFSGRILNHNKCLDNGGLSWWTNQQTSNFGGSGWGTSGAPEKKMQQDRHDLLEVCFENNFLLTLVNCTWLFFVFQMYESNFWGRQWVRKEHPKILWNLCNLASWWDASSWLVHFVFDLEVQTHTFPNNNCLLEEGNSIFKNCYFCQGSDFLF